MIVEDENSYSDEEEEEYEESNEYVEYNYYNSQQQQSSSKIYMCETCEREFQTYWQHQKHMSEHRTCGIDGCTFTAHGKIIEKHVQMQHSSGLYDKIRNVVTPEDIAKWIEERKKKYPNKENVEKRYKQQEEMLKRGEKLKGNSSRFDKNNRTRFSLNRQNNPNQRLRNKRVLTKRKLAQNQQQNKPISLIDDKADWNGTLFPFKGTGQLYNEEPTENSNDFDDTEWAEETTSNAPQKIVLKNALGALMSAYNSDDDSEIEDIIPNNEIVMPKTEINILGTTEKTSLVMVEKIKEENTDVNSSEVDASTEQKNDQIKVSVESDDEAPTEQKIERLEMPIISNALNGCEVPAEQKIERSEIPITNNASGNHEIHPEQKTNQAQKPNDNKRTRKRKRVHRKMSNDFKQQKHGTSSNTSKQYSKTKSGEFSKNLYKKRRITLLERLLANEITHERNVLLQCVRYVVANGFFDENSNGDKKEEVNTEKTSACERKDVDVPVDSTNENSVV